VTGAAPGATTGRGPDENQRPPTNVVRLRHARAAVVAYFAMEGIANGVWLARIPAVKENLHLTDSALGIALLAAPAGLVLGVAVAGRIMRRTGSRLPVVIAGTCNALAPIALGLASGMAALMAALFALGLTGGITDIGVNSQAVLVERRVGRPLMSSFHSSYSFGGLAGGLVGGAFAWAGIGPAVNFTAVAIPLACLVLLTAGWLLPDQRGKGMPSPAAVRPQAPEPMAGRSSPGGRPPGPPSTRMNLLLAAMAVIAVCSLLGEGAADGWSAVYLHDNLGAPAGLAAVGYAAFCVAMAVGRLSGDRLAARFGAAVLLRCCGLVAAAGLALALLSHSQVGAIAGFAGFGAGLSCTFPLVLSAAGNVDPQHPAHGISRVAGVGYAGMLGGPVLIGGLAGAFGLRWALTVPALLALVIAAGAAVAAPRSSPRRES
jgi:MFS family permease